jgi:hypothetical protein
MTLSGPAMGQNPPSAVHRIATHGGITYDYTVSTSRRGHQEIVGRDSRGDTFALRVAGSSVTGRYGRDPVSFTISPRTARSLEVATTTN